MGSLSTFGAFTTARLGMYASMKGLDITGHNIANINTIGYTRQRLDQSALKVNGADRYFSIYDARVGSGALVTGISQLRDPYLDIRFRNENASVGAADAKLSGLDNVAQIMDEVAKNDGDGVLEKQFTDLLMQLQNLSTKPNQTEYQDLVRSSASTLTTLLNTYSKSLEGVAKDQETSYQQDVNTVNGILSSIRNLNDSIRNSEIHGDGALELRDQRNLLLDQLSQYAKINVTYNKQNLGAGIEVDNLVITLDDGRNTPLVDGSYSGQLSIGTGPDKFLTLSPLENRNGNLLVPNATPTLLDSGLTGSLEATRQMLTCAGEFTVGGVPTTDRGIPYYRNALDSLAQKFASVMNTANQANGPLFSNSNQGNDVTDITAGNISISKGWADNSVEILASTGGGDPADNILHIIYQLGSASHDFIPSETVPGASGVPFAKGTFQKMLAGVQATLADDIKGTTAMLRNYAATAEELNVGRDSVSSVDLNDEAASMMQYQKSYAAACRLMTTIDEALDKLINGTGVVGR